MKRSRYTWFWGVWRKLKLILWGVGGFLVFAALVECARAYQVLYGVHPVLGIVFLAFLLAVVIVGLVYVVVAMTRRPAVLLSPPKCDLPTAAPAEVRRYARYLADVMDGLALNPLVPEDCMVTLRAEGAALRPRITRRERTRELAAELQRITDDVIVPAVAPLDAEAERRVRHSVRDTMVGVTVSPWRSLDLFVVLYRSGRMVLDVSAIYNGRPRLHEQMQIIGDVLKIAATVQFLNIGSKLVENLTSWIPVVGRFTDDIAQGLGAGLFTSVAGHAAIDRCRAFRGWSEAEARDSIAARLKFFMQDLKGIVSDSVVPALKGRIEAQVPEERRTPNLMDRIKTGVGEAIDATSETMETFVRQPVMVGYKGVASTGAGLWRETKRAGTGMGKVASWTGRKSWQFASRSATTVGRGVAHVGKAGGKGATGAAKRLSGMMRRPSHKADNE